MEHLKIFTEEVRLLREGIQAAATKKAADREAKEAAEAARKAATLKFSAKVKDFFKTFIEVWPGLTAYEGTSLPDRPHGVQDLRSKFKFEVVIGRPDGLVTYTSEGVRSRGIEGDTLSPEFFEEEPFLRLVLGELKKDYVARGEYLEPTKTDP